MAPALVSAGSVATSATNSISPTFGATPGAGNVLVALVVAGGHNALGDITTATSGWVQADEGAAPTRANAAIFYNLTSNGATAPTFSQAASVTNYMKAQLFEFSGVDTAVGLDKHGNVNATSGTTITPTASGADTQSGDLVLSAYCYSGTSQAITTSNSANNGITDNNTGQDDSTVAARHFRFMAWGITTGNSAADADTITTTAGTNMAAAIASFSPSAASGPVDQNPLRYGYGSN